MLQGEAGYSRKSERGQASYYYSQPFFKATGIITIDDKPVEVTGQAWMDREWSSQPLAADQTGWDWFSLHLATGEKLMLFRLRQTDGNNYRVRQLDRAATATHDSLLRRHRDDADGLTEIEGRKLPTAWRIEIPRARADDRGHPAQSASWMETSFPYWEGPIFFRAATAA